MRNRPRSHCHAQQRRVAASRRTGSNDCDECNRQKLQQEGTASSESPWRQDSTQNQGVRARTGCRTRRRHPRSSRWSLRIDGPRGVPGVVVYDERVQTLRRNPRRHNPRVCGSPTPTAHEWHSPTVTGSTRCMDLTGPDIAVPDGQTQPSNGECSDGPGDYRAA